MVTFSILHASDFHIAAQSDRGPPALERWDAGEAPLAILREMRASEWLSITPSSYSAFAARSFARFMRRNRQFEVDAFVISGDIATSAKKADLDVAHAFLFGAADSTHKPRMKLESAEFPTIIIPGNHDRFGFLHFPGVALFDDLFPNWEGGTRVISKSIRRGCDAQNRRRGSFAGPLLGRLEYFRLCGPRARVRGSNRGIVFRIE